MSCSDCHYFRGIKGTPFGRCYNHPDEGRILYDDGIPVGPAAPGIFITPRWGNFMCEAVKREPRPWEKIANDFEIRSSMDPSKKHSH